MYTSLARTTIPCKTFPLDIYWTKVQLSVISIYIKIRKKINTLFGFTHFMRYNILFFALGYNSVTAAIFIFYSMPVMLLAYNINCRYGSLCPEL